MKKKKKNNKLKNSENELYNIPVIRFWSFLEDPHIMTIGTLL